MTSEEYQDRLQIGEPEVLRSPSLMQALSIFGRVPCSNGYSLDEIKNLLFLRPIMKDSADMSVEARYFFNSVPGEA